MPDEYTELDAEERDQIISCLPSLLEENITELSDKQLKALHYILGFNAEPDTEAFQSLLVEYNFSETVIDAIIDIVKEDGIMIIQPSY